jgi:thioredoxin reductase
MIYDLIIVGLGPAGMTAGIFAARREMKTLIIGRDLGGQLVWANEIENYPGVPKTTSFDLIEKMHTQATTAGAEIKTDEVKKIEKQVDGSFIVYTLRESYQARALVIALGLSPRRLAIPGEIEFNGHGVSYCANCDGPFYKNKSVAVVGGGNSALDAAEVLSKIAAQVYLIHRNENFRGFESLQTEIESRDNIEIILDSEIKEITGGDKLEKIKIINTKTQAERELKLDGV